MSFECWWDDVPESIYDSYWDIVDISDVLVGGWTHITISKLGLTADIDAAFEGSGISWRWKSSIDIRIEQDFGRQS
jgi:hypothetical protein